VAAGIAFWLIAPVRAPEPVAEPVPV
jgi:hypothetical protein